MRLVASNVVLSIVSALFSLCGSPVSAQDRSLKENPELASYFEAEVSRLEQQNELTRFNSPEEWQKARPVLREQLFDMLGLSPRPAMSPLESVVEGTLEAGEFVVERIHFQSMPGLYVTGNFYRPKIADKPLPTILYVCGHGQVKKDGVSYGNKTHYHYHGAWFARNGFNCLMIDTLQLGEIEGVHHGTYKMNRWWWNSRGYTPAGVEAWNCIRSLDYLQTRSEVDAEKIGVTGRSGGGAYSWWISALDDRIQCAVPVAGITNLRDHVVNGCVEGHCDCMYMVNTFRWDYATVAALVAPRPLLISNTDKDTIFPLEGVVDIHRQVRHVYQLLDAGDSLGLQITEGPHKDTQELHIHAFRWFNRFLKNDDSMIQKTADKFFQPEQLKVLSQTPTDEINTRIDEIFVAPAKSISPAELLATQDKIPKTLTLTLRNRCFGAWPQNYGDPIFREVTVSREAELNRGNVIRLSFESQPHVPLTVDVVVPAGIELQNLRSLELTIEFGANPVGIVGSQLPTPEGHAVMAPRGVGRNAWVGNEARQIQIQRRFQLIGSTVDAMRVWDIRRAIQVVRQQCPNLKELRVRASHGSESLVLLASLFEPPVDVLVIPDLNPSLEQQPSILNLTRTMPMEMLPVLAAAKAAIVTGTTAGEAKFAAQVTGAAEWNGKKIEFAE